MGASVDDVTEGPEGAEVGGKVSAPRHWLPPPQARDSSTGIQIQYSCSQIEINRFMASEERFNIL